MKHRILTLTLLLTAITFAAEANPVDMNTAREVAMKFVNANTKTHLRNTDELQLVTTYSISRGDAAFHIFNTPNGFVIVSADDCATPILGYSDEGRPFDPDNVPVQLQDYLQGFVEQIEYGIENHIVADENTVRQWELVQAMGRLNDNRDGEAVEPLVTAMWGQGCYYNNMCPEDAGGDCGHAKVGCVATAMGMIMHYWSYPRYGSGHHKYYSWGYPEQSVSFIETEYYWSNMPNSLTESSSQEEIDAVATLLWHCGVAVDMEFGADASGAYGTFCINALTNYFSYSNDLYISNRDDNDFWLEDIKSDLMASHPVLISGVDDDNNFEAHFFICDGYDSSDMIHLNWGWNGIDNGYFPVGALNVSNFQFNTANYAVLNIVPKCEEGSSFDVSVNSSDPDKGYVTGSGSYECGDVCEIVAIPAEGFKFNYWSESGSFVSTSANYKFVVTSDCNLEAHFSVQAFSVLAASKSIKSGTISGVTNNAVLAYDNGDFAGAVGVSGGGSSYWGVMYPTNMLESLDGMYLNKINVFNHEVYDGEVLIYKGGDNAPVNFVYQQNYHCSTVEAFESIYLTNPVQIDVNENLWIILHNFNGNYVETYSSNLDDPNGYWFGGIEFHTSPWSPLDWGTWMIRGCVESLDFTGHSGIYWTGDFQENDTCTITAVPNEGCYFESWSENGEIVSTDETYSFLVVNDRELHANFTCSINASANPMEGGMVTGGGRYFSGETCTLTAVANENYTFCYWLENEEVVSTEEVYSFPVSESRNLQAVFALPFTISATPNINNSGIIDGGGEYNYGSTCSLTAIPSEGYVFQKWVENGIIVSTNPEYSFTVTSNVNLVAFFIESETTTCEIVFDLEWYPLNYLIVDYDDGTTDRFTVNPMESCLITINRTIIDGSHIEIGAEMSETYFVCSFSLNYTNGIHICNFASSDFLNDFHYEFDVNCSANSGYHFTTPGNWSEPTNWSDSTLPSTDAIVFIDAPCQLDQNASVAALTVSDGQSLTLLSGNTLTVTGTLVNADASGLVIKDGAQIIHSSEGVYATMEKDITGYTDDGGFCLLAVPFTDSVSVPEQMTGGEYDLYLFDQYYPNAEWRNHKADAFSLVRGQGYLYANSNDTTLTLTGQIPPSDEPFSVNLTYDANAINPGYNLVGNPFTCDAYIDRAYYVLNEDGSGINPVEVSASIPIPPCTSVVVKALDENDTVVFTKATH